MRMIKLRHIQQFLLTAAIALASVCVYAQKPYISKVYEYRPAPGQFINVLPTYEAGDSETEMIAKAEAQIVGRVGSTNYICLGAWGGYVTFGFDHSLVNVEGEYDMKIYGNAFTSGTPDEEGRQFGSPEPGIIYVSQDANGNGLPDDVWYEIAGSEAASANRTYRVTYTNAGPTSDVPWQDNAGGTGRVARNIFHQQPYYPEWIAAPTLTFSGTILPPNVVGEEGETPRAYMYEYGYADNWPNNDERSNINLEWAIDAAGNPANLAYVDFVRVQTGVMVDWGVSGEMSTEVCGAEDLHPEAQKPEGIETIRGTQAGHKWVKDGVIYIERGGRIYSILGELTTNNKLTIQ